MVGDVGRGARFLSSGLVTAAFSRRRRNSLGFERFLSRDDFAAFIKTDRFVIRCELTVFPPPPKPSVARAAPPPPEPNRPTRAPPASGLSADLGRLLETKEGADVSLEVHGKVFAAHKSVLAARSPFFMEEFFRDTSYIVINDILPDAFEALLQYIYTDTLPETTITMNNSLKEGPVVLEDLLMAADRYKLKDLKSVIENRLCSHVGSVSTVLVLLELAEKYQCCKLKKMCLGFIGSGRNAREIVMASDGIENLARSSPSVVKDVIAEILDLREARSRRLVDVCVYALCFVITVLPFLVFDILIKE